MSDLITSVDFDKWALPSTAGVDSGVKTAACSSGSKEAESYLRARYAFPLASWGDDVREKACALAALSALQTTGYNPEEASGIAVERRARTAREWFRAVAAGDLNPDVSDAGSAVSSPIAYSETSRGW